MYKGNVYFYKKEMEMMDTKRAKKLLDEVLMKNKQKQQVCLTQTKESTSHNGIKSKNADFIDSLNDSKIMEQVVKEMAKDVNNLVRSA